jgi:4-hydroxybenzoate polyprenyltransferase
MLETIKLLGTVSRAEFLLPNLGSLIMGLAWGATPPLSFADLLVLIVLSFTIINLSSAIGAQVNTISDYELDKRDERKKQLVQAVDSLGRSKLKISLVVEFLVTLALVSLFMLVQGKPILLYLWMVGISLGCAYSAPPFRLKSRSWLAPTSLILVLAVFPVMFAYLTFTSEINSLFLLSLTGLALTVYAVIIPTEIRDYFGDREMNIETMTVHLGLVKASSLGMVLLSVGSTFFGTAFLLEFAYGHHPLLSVFLFALPVAVLIVLGKFKRLYSLCREYQRSQGQSSIAQEITRLSAHNPQWIMLITQTYSFLSIILLVSKFWP